MKPETLKTIRFVAWWLVIAAALMFLGLQAGLIKKDYASAGDAAAVMQPGALGGPFTLATMDGAPFTEKSLEGRPTLMFFGFTSCPDVCPTTLADMSRWMEKLKGDTDKLNVLFITVDPARDTGEVLKTYMKPFDKRILALRGDEKALADMAKKYKFYYKKMPDEELGYAMDHTASVLLFDKTQHFVGTVDFDEKDKIAVEKIRLLLKR